MKYENALSLFYPTIVWKSAGRGIYSEIEYISGPALPSKAQLDSDIASYNFVGGSMKQFINGTIPMMSGTTQFAYNSTVPTTASGFQVWSRSVSVSSPTSLIVIRAVMSVDHNTNTRNIIAGLFAGTECLGTSMSFITTAGRPANLCMQITHVPGAVGNVTYSLRVGANGSGTTFVNLGSGGQTLGNTLTSAYTITEID